MGILEKVLEPFHTVTGLIQKEDRVVAQKKVKRNALKSQPAFYKSIIQKAHADIDGKRQLFIDTMYTPAEAKDFELFSSSLYGKSSQRCRSAPAHLLDIQRRNESSRRKRNHSVLAENAGDRRKASPDRHSRQRDLRGRKAKRTNGIRA